MPKEKDPLPAELLRALQNPDVPLPEEELALQNVLAWMGLPVQRVVYPGSAPVLPLDRFAWNLSRGAEETTATTTTS